MIAILIFKILALLVFFVVVLRLLGSVIMLVTAPLYKKESKLIPCNTDQFQINQVDIFCFSISSTLFITLQWLI